MACERTKVRLAGAGLLARANPQEQGLELLSRVEVRARRARLRNGYAHPVWIQYGIRVKARDTFALCFILFRCAVC